MAPWWSVKPTSLAEDQPRPVEQQPDGEGDWLDKLWADEDLAPAVRKQPVDTDGDTDDTDDTDADTDAAEDGDEEEGRWFRRDAGYWPRPSLPSLPERTALSPGTRRLIYNVSAAGVGWWCGLAPEIRGWIEDCGRSTSIGGALTLGGGICLGLAVFWDSRTRHWQPGPLAWVARIPLASAITALALYAPASQF